MKQEKRYGSFFFADNIARYPIRFCYDNFSGLHTLSKYHTVNKYFSFFGIAVSIYSFGYGMELFRNSPKLTAAIVPVQSLLIMNSFQYNASVDHQNLTVYN